jgi:glycosyltransferase involved in cell wall biosynthesis
MQRHDQLLRRLRLASFRSRLPYAEIVFPQTHTAFTRLNRYYSDRIVRMAIVPTAFSRLVPPSRPEPVRIPQGKGTIDLLCLTRYYPHKNIEVFLEVGELIKKANLPFRIITTLGNTQHRAVGTYLREVDQRHLRDILINIGPVPIDQVASLYGQTRGLILPTLLESFSATYADSLHSGVPVFTSERDFAQEVCGDAAWYFDPLDAHSIVSVLQDAFSRPQAMKKRIEVGKERSATFPDWPKVADMYISYLTTLVQESRA